MAEPGQWHHLSPWAVMLLWVRGVIDFVRENLPLVVGAGAGAAFIEAVGLREVALAAVVLLAGAGLLSLQYYRRFRFRLEGDVLFVQRGLFERRELKVAADRVQHVTIDQPAYMRPFGVVRFSLETPGGATTEVELPGIARAYAETLRDALGAARTRAAAGDDEGEARPAPPARTLFRLGGGGLTLHGVVSNYAYVLAAALTPLLQPLERAARARFGPWEEVAWLAWASDHPVLFAGVALATLLFAMVTASVLAAWFRFFDYRLLRKEGRYVQTSGLLSRQEQALPAAKLQSVDWVQTALGRLLGRGHLVCHQYGGVAPGVEHLGHSFLVPGLDRASATRLSAEFWPGLEVGAWRPVHAAYRRVQALRLGAGITGTVLLVAALTGEPRAAWMLLVVAPLAWGLAHLQWRALAWQSARYTLVRRGLLGRRTVQFPLEHVQTVTLRQSWFQRRRRLASLELVLPSGPVSIPYIEEAEARRMADEALFRVERLFPRGVTPAAAQGGTGEPDVLDVT
ncbi:PH domain-containing protein [Ectothiorhodospiraceae bacterium 2226]|nr:PH domain-containing protein [Ectothiorhodospiraceae bacterium 2226]